MARTNRNKRFRPTKQFVEDLYVKQALSLDECAKKVGCAKSTFRNLLLRFDVPIRSASDAMKLALEAGRKEHPTKGKKLTEETKEKISKARIASWANYTDKEYKELIESYKKRWNERSDAERQKFKEAAQKALQETTKNGSKLEKSVASSLQEAGHRVELHRSSILNNQNLEMDILIPKHNIVIEIDGPTHFFPIFGEDRLKKVQESDADKNGLLLQAGYVIIRVQHIEKNLSKRKEQEFGEAVVKQVEEVINNRPTKSEDCLIFIRRKNGRRSK